MDIKTENIGTTLVVKVTGEIDHHTTPKLKEEIDREINLRNIINLVLDFDGVSFMDSSGIGVLAGRYKQIQARGGRTMVPVRAISEAFECIVDWEEETQTVIINR